ncbi:MAG: alpha/beta hydrolase [Alphaproteobacteria bacterium]|nr:alpha/beta hydrolase [Alphaproteobacteria bacterium]
MAQILLTCLIAYVVIVAALYLVQRQLIYFPSTERPRPADWNLPDMSAQALTAADGVEVYAWYRPAERGRATMVFFCGNAGHVGYRAEKVRTFLDAGLGVLLLSYRGYGGNGGAPSEQGLYADARAAMVFLDQRGVAPETIVLYGESLGSGIATQIALERAAVGNPVGAMVLEAPYTSVVDVAQDRFPWIPVRFLVRDRFDNQSRIDQAAAPLLVIHGHRDRVIPFRFGRRLYEAASQPKQFHELPEASHNDLYNFGTAAVIVEFLDRHLAADGAASEQPAAETADRP